MLRGPNGAGKTTLLRLVTGQLRASEGRVLVAGEEPMRRAPNFRRRVAGMIGLPPFARDLTLAEQATLIGVTWGHSTKSAHSEAETLFSELGIDHLMKRYPNELSSGQTQLAGLGMTLLRPCEVLVLDEPEQRLDAVRLTWVIEVLHKRLEKGVAILLASHSDRFASELNSRTLNVVGA